jgi:peptide/nickel transport system substrate-binding protein
MLETGDVDRVFVPKQYVDQLDALIAEDCDCTTEECTTINPDGTLRVFRNWGAGSYAVDFFFSMDVPQASTFIGSGALDGGGVPPGFFADVNIRRAFAACFDYETYIDEVERGEAFRRSGPIPLDHLGYDPADPPPVQYDLAACEAYFKGADVDHDGIPAGEDEDDVWETGFFMMLGYNTGNDQRRVAAEMLKANVESINERFHIEVLALPWPAYLKQTSARMIPIYAIGWQEVYRHPHIWVQPYLSSAGMFGSALKLPDEIQARFDELIGEAKATLGPEAQHEAYKALQRLAAEQQTSLWGILPVDRSYERMWLEGTYCNPSYVCPFAYGLSESDESPHPTTFLAATIAEPESFDPADIADTSSGCWIRRFYDPLIHTKRERDDEFVGQLADSWDVSDDGLTYTFHIREGVKFHEGGDLDAHDAAYAIWRGLLRDPAAGLQFMFWEAFFGSGGVEGYAIDKANAALGL